MLRSLAIRNFVLIADATLEPAPGFTALTGETGAGKTLLTQALELLLGERASDDLIGPAGDEARVQAVFELGPGEIALLPEEVVDLAGVAGGELIATRRLQRGGRNRCYLNDSACTLGSLGGALRPLLAFSGQHEHRRLLDAAYQRSVLDSLAGEDLRRELGDYREAWREARHAGALLQEAYADRDERLREQALLEFQVAELEEAGLSEEEEASLAQEQRRLARAEEILAETGRAAELLTSEAAESDALSLVDRAAAALERIADVDEELAAAARTVGEAGHLLREAARDLHAYTGSVEIDPARLEEVEARLRTYLELARKYGGTTGAAVSFAADGRRRLDELTRAEHDVTDLERRRAEAVEEAERRAAELSRLRAETAPRVEEAIAGELAALGMSDTVVAVRVTSGATWEELGPDGADTVDILVAPNAGLPLRSLRRTASGGELSRTLLAIKAALAGVESRETLVFDEIDAGIGGRTATAVGAKLRAISRGNQLLVITHLAQVAAFADAHILIEKGREGAGTTTRLRPLGEAESLDELRRMMGGGADDEAALEHARRLRDRAVAGLID